MDGARCCYRAWLPLLPLCAVAAAHAMRGFGCCRCVWLLLLPPGGALLLPLCAWLQLLPPCVAVAAAVVHGCC